MPPLTVLENPRAVLFRKLSEEYFSRKDYDVTAQTCRLVGFMALKGSRSAEMNMNLSTELKTFIAILGGEQPGLAGALAALLQLDCRPWVDTDPGSLPLAGNDISRYLLLIRELALVVPNIVQPYVPQILAYIWSSLKDQRLVLRERAALLVSQCLQIHSASPGPTRDTKGRFQSYEKLLDEAKNGLIQMGNMEAVHGSMMVCQALFDHGEMVSIRRARVSGNLKLNAPFCSHSQFMDVHYDKVCDLILRHKESKDSIIRKTVITLIPHMAAYDPQGFCDEHHAGGTTTMMGFSFLTVSMRFLLGQLKKPEKAFGAWSATAQPGRSVLKLDCLPARSLPEHRSRRGQGRDRDEGLPRRHSDGHPGRPLAARQEERAARGSDLPMHRHARPSLRPNPDEAHARPARAHVCLGSRRAFA